MAELYHYHQWRTPEEKGISQYSSKHSILLVGEGDFSFSRSLAMAFDQAPNIVATSLDSYVELIKKYRNAGSNLAMLYARRATVLYSVDATRMCELYYLKSKKFHRIIFNFPHAGFGGREDDPLLINKHRDLVRGFLSNAKVLLTHDGEIHIRHKVTPPFTHWKIDELGKECSLFFIGLDEFRIEEYPGYENKRGASSRADEPFPLGECRTYKFGQCPSVPLPWLPSSSSLNFNDALPNVDYRIECRTIFGSYLDHIEETFGRVSYDVQESVRDALRRGFEAYMSVMPGRSLNGYIQILEELHRLSNLRIQWLQRMMICTQMTQLT